MSTLTPIDAEKATGKTKELLELVRQRTGRIPNMIGLMANSPAALGAYLGFAMAFRDATLSAEIRDLIAVTAAEASGCDYTLSAMSALARRGGRSDNEIASARAAEAQDAKTRAALQFAAKLVRASGHLSPAEIEALRTVGFADGEIAEIVAAVLLTLYRSYFNLIARPEIDFPVLRTGKAAA